MEFLGTYFLWFLVASVVAAVVAIVLQLRNMKNFHKDFFKKAEEGDPFSSMFSKFLPVAIAALTAGVSFVLFVVGVIVNLINQTP